MKTLTQAIVLGLASAVMTAPVMAAETQPVTLQEFAA